MTVPSRLPVHLVTGDDAGLVSHRMSSVLDAVCGSDRAMVLTEAGPESDLRQLLRSIPLFSEYQVVLYRGVPDAGLVEYLVEYLRSPEPTTTLVVAASKVPSELTKAVKAAGGEHFDTSPKKPADTARMLLDEAEVVLDARTKQLLIAHVGEEVNQIPSILASLLSTYGPRARLGMMEVEPFLGEAGGVPPWDLTDAIDRGDAPGALKVLHRMLRARVPLVVLVSVQAHVERLFRLSESGIRSEKEAALFLGMKGSTYPAKKALQVLPRWRDLADAMKLVGDAATDLRGGSSLPPELVLEILVARLAARR